jgi:serine/threonine-protein kinase HipA
MRDEMNREDEADILEIRLGDVPVGTITRLSHDRNEFVFAESYRERYPRLVLGQFFEDDLSRRHSSRTRLPAFFSNLLPEGPLRELIGRRAEAHPEREFHLLAHLGMDLPGAVVATPKRALAPDLSAPELEAEGPLEPGPLRFSLAGVQLKFSMLREGRGLTLPMSGAGGDWIVKLPDNRYDRVPENEYSMMTWARAAGITVPEFDLVRVADLYGLPEGLGLKEPLAFAIRRFDRPAPGKRIHMEDFAQVLGVYPKQKYSFGNYETIASILLALAGPTALVEFLHRLVFVIAIGNADAHLKNWSIIYPDGVHPELSPAYDFVSTIQYIHQDRLALNLAKSKRFEHASMASFRRMATRLEVEERLVTGAVREAVEATLESWPGVRESLPLPASAKERIEAHLRAVPLLRKA